MGDGSCLENSRAMSLVSSTLTPSAICALGRSAEVPAFQAGEVGSTPAGHFGDRLMVGRLPLKQKMKVRLLLPESMKIDMCKQTMRDRLTVGRDALNVLMLVRFQLPQLRTEVIRPDEDAVLKTVGRTRDLWVRVPRLPLLQSCGLAAKAAPLQGDDRWFESTQDYFRPGTPTGRAARLKPGRLQVRLLLWAHGSVGNR
jgi:hypothetical protein